MTCSDTLVVKNIPSILSDRDKEEFLKYFGALNVVILNSSHQKKCTVFAKFESPAVAKAVLFRLHQKELSGNRLSVEFSDSKVPHLYNNLDNQDKKNANDDNYYEEFLRELNSWTRDLNFKLPPPHHLKYRYPAPNPEVLYNISNMLLSVPKFYTQVLHLMNKMNLPCPFESDYPLEDNELFDQFLLFIYEKTKLKLQLNESSSEFESELESDDDESTNKLNASVTKRKRLRQRRGMTGLKILKLMKKSSALMTNKSSSVQLEDVFEKVGQDVSQKKIELNVPEKINVDQQQHEQSTKTESQGFGILYPSGKSKEEEMEEKHVENKEEESEAKNEECDADECISAEKLASNRITEKNRKLLPVYKKYQAGTASCRLYIKNLSKHVTRKDLLYIYKRYFIRGIDEQGTMFDIRLMQEGRMKGQAFVTLQNIKQAKLALEETNGYILKDKPMVVQFARSAMIK